MKLKPTPEDFASARLISYAAYQWPAYFDAPHHRLIARKLEAVERGEIKRLMISMPPRHGKALHLDTPIPTPSGWSRIGSLRAGDEVFSDTGSVCKVVAVSEVWSDRPIYSVETDDGDVILADADHEWRVRLDRKRPVFKNKTTEFIAKRSCNRLAMIEAQGALDLPDADLPVDPYVIGVWLGDGTSRTSAITSADEEIVSEVSRLEGGHNEYVRLGTAKLFRAGPHYREGCEQSATLQSRLRVLGLLENKHIPSIYLRASKSQRLSLLQGLIDTDGYVADDGQVEFCSTRLILAENVKELVASLGHKASIIHGRATLGGRDCGPKYRVMFYMAGCARLARKAQKTRHGMRAFRRYIKVKRAGTGKTVCIQVDSPSNMFLAGRSMLPTHNSMLASEFFPAWYIGRNPDRYVVISTYAQDLADDFGRKVRNQIEDPLFAQVFPGVRLSDDSKSVKRFHVEGLDQEGGFEHRLNQKGAFYSVGVGGPLTGRGAHLLLIDDPVKNREEADSEIIRRRTKDWYTSTAYTRLMPGGAIVVIQTRWNEDDLTGWLQKEHAHEGWEILSLPAINDSGEALWPEQYDIEALERIRRALPVRDWSALYQQTPTPETGDYFKAEWLIPVDERLVPPKENLRIYGGSDYAVTSEGGDYTVHAVVGIDQNDDPWLLDLWREQTSSDVWVSSFCDLVLLWKPMGWAEEQGQIKSSVGPFLVKEMRRRNAHVAREQFSTRGGDKGVRAQSFRGMVATRGLRYSSTAPWRAEFESELLRFPAGVHDDQVDACGLIGQLIDRMTTGKVPRKDQARPGNGYASASDDRRDHDVLTL